MLSTLEAHLSKHATHLFMIDIFIHIMPHFMFETLKNIHLTERRLCFSTTLIMSNVSAIEHFLDISCY